MLGACPKTKKSNDLFVIKKILSNKSIPTIATNGRTIKFPGFALRSFQNIGDVSLSSSFLFFGSFLLPLPKRRLVFELGLGSDGFETTVFESLNRLFSVVIIVALDLGAG